MKSALRSIALIAAYSTYSVQSHRDKIPDSKLHSLLLDVDKDVSNYPTRGEAVNPTRSFTLSNMRGIGFSHFTTEFMLGTGRANRTPMTLKIAFPRLQR